MTTDTEALRAKFEHKFGKSPYEFELSRFPETGAWAGQYTSYKTQCAWEGYLAGHAAAKAENAAAVAAERERCAAVCDRYASALDYSGNAYVRSRECQQAAAAIRAGAKEPSDA